MTGNREPLSYGWAYHLFLDPPLADARQVAVNLIPSGATVLDAACGTGLLCTALRKKGCRVVGLDLSERMLRFAAKHNPYPDVRFVHGNAADLSGFADRGFDYATLLLLIHELPRETQLRVLTEAARVAGRIIIIDSAVPLPKNGGARGIRFAEATFGRGHQHHFKAFLAGGGITGLLEAAALPLAVEHRMIFWRGCREVVVASVRSPATPGESPV